METLFSIVLYILFGKRIKKKWEFAAEFRDEIDRESGCEKKRL